MGDLYKYLESRTVYILGVLIICLTDNFYSSSGFLLHTHWRTVIVQYGVNTNASVPTIANDHTLRINGTSAPACDYTAEQIIPRKVVECPNRRFPGRIPGLHKATLIALEWLRNLNVCPWSLPGNPCRLQKPFNLILLFFIHFWDCLLGVLSTMLVLWKWLNFFGFLRELYWTRRFPFQCPNTLWC